MDLERGVQGNGMSGGAGLLFGSRNSDLPQVPQSEIKGLQALGLDAVVIGQEDSHGYQLSVLSYQLSA
jgi:hypothetical protein